MTSQASAASSVIQRHADRRAHRWGLIGSEISWHGAKCGKCGANVFVGHPEDVNAEIFDRQIGRSTMPVLVDVWAPWCGPCLTMAPAYEAAARELEPQVRLIKLNSDAEQAIASRLGIRGIPTMILFLEGREVARTSGAMSAAQIVRWVRDRLPAIVVWAR